MYLLGIDLGTSSAKAALFAADSLALIASAAEEHPVLHLQPGYAEQSPHDWWRAVVTAVRATIAGIDPMLVKGIGLSGQMHGLLCLDHDQQPVHPAIIWADGRSRQEVQDLARWQKASAIVLPGPPATGFAAASALWLSRQRPEILRRTSVCLLPKDYLRLRMTGLVGSEPSDASSTWLYDLAAEEWASEVVRYCGLRMEQMPPIRGSAALFGALRPAAAAELGLPAGIPVVTGSADLAAQALGHGVVEPGKVLVTVGTGGQVMTPILRPQVRAGQGIYTFSHSMESRWYWQAAILSAGLSLRWLRDLLGLKGRDDAYAHLSNLAAAVPPGAEGLIFLPYLAGERTPHLDPQASGCFVGLRLHHGPGHLARAVMEGVAFALKECLELIDADASSEIVLSGGVTQSRVWPQIMADVWGRPLIIAEQDVSRACMGAAILVGLGTGTYAHVAEALALQSGCEQPLFPKETPIYVERYAQYRRLYPLLNEEMRLR